MRILVTGSRNWDHAGLIADHIAEWADKATDPVDIVHGACRGADLLAANVAQMIGFGDESHPANWSKYGKRAGFVRNAEMVALGADVCLAFIRDNSKGATMCADLAEKAGIPTVRISYPS